MRIVIAGPGSLGCLLAARLCSVLCSGDDLLLLDHHRERARQLNQSGFTLEHNGKTSHYMVQTTADPRHIKRCDFFLLCTRSGDVDTALAQAESLLSPTTMLIGFQRGIKLLQNLIMPVALARSSSDTFLDSPGHVTCCDSGTIVIGQPDKSAAAEHRLDLLVQMFNAAGMHTRKTRDIEKKVWDIFLQDLAINALAAIYGRPYGQLLSSCSVRGNLKKVLKEAMAVARAQGITISGDPIRTAFHTLRTDTKKIAPMFRDIQNKRVTEIDALNGALVKLGRQLSIPTPINEDLVLRIKKLEEHYRTC